MPLGAQLGGHSQVFPIRPAGHGQCGDGAVHPGVQDILLRNKIVAAAFALGRRPGLIGIEGQPLLFSHQNLSAGAAVPDGYGRGEDPLPGYAPVPLHRVGPVFEPDLHMRRHPFYLLCRPLDLLGIDAHKPLPLRENLYGGLAPPAQAHILLQGLLLEDYLLLLHIPDDPLLGLADRATGIGPCHGS